MNNLNLSTYEVKEMNEVQMKEINGGFHPFIVAFAVYLAWDIAMNPSDAAAAFSEGMNERMNMR